MLVAQSSENSLLRIHPHKSMVPLGVQAFASGNLLGLVAWILSYLGAKYHLARQLIRAQQRAKESKAPRVRAEKVLPTQEEEAGNKGHDTAAAAQAASILAASREMSIGNTIEFLCYHV